MAKGAFRPALCCILSRPEFMLRACFYYYLEGNIMTKTRKLTTMAMLTAISVVLALTIHPTVIAPLEYDPGDIPILIGGFLFGPLAGLVITLITSILQGLIVSAQSGLWGILMHFIATGTFVVVASLIYNRNKSLKRAIIGMICGGLVMTAVMIPANIIVQPLWNMVPVEAVKGMILPVLLPFNLGKAAVNGLVTFLVYKPVSNLIKLPVEKGKGKSEA